jgi:Asp/Glu/hydantoin racemase
MSARVAFVHTVGFLADEFRKLMRAELPEVDSFHILNESLLQDLLRGVPPPRVYRRVTEQLMLAADAGADLIVMTCSSTSPGVDVARQMIDRPILKIDDPMAAEAVWRGARIGLLCTATSTVGPSTALLNLHAAQQGRQVRIQPQVNAQAYQALLSGDRATHDRLVSESAARLAADVDVLVLAQASLAHLAEPLAAQLPCPVLASPSLLMRDLAHRLTQA